MKILKNIFGVLIVFIISHLSAIYFGSIYSYFFPKAIGDGGVFLVSQEMGFYIAGITAAYSFFLFLIFTAFGDKWKYWWMGVLALPALAFEVYFDLSHIYFPIILGIIGWAIGFGIRALVGKFKVSKSAP